MSSTIDNTNTNILNKIHELQRIIDIYDRYNLDEKDNIAIMTLLENIDELLTSYEFGSIDILKGYYQASDADKQQHYKRYMKFITTENVVGKLKRIYTHCRKLQKSYEIDDEDLYDAFCKYDYASIDVDPVDKIGNSCACGHQMHVESKTSESICNKCGSTEKLYGVVFEDEQFFYQEGQRTKHGKYDPTKHCKFWVDRIQAKESAEIPEKIINTIKRRIKRDNVWLERLNCSIIRDYLKEIKETGYNDHIPLIRKIITGVEPPQLTDYELKLVYVYFNRVMQIYNKTKPDDKLNSPYHPFFVYKILEQILKKPDDRLRRDEILSSIHLQSRETLINHDLIWHSICAEIADFTYIPTDGNK
jgi:hypothetical protein